ncbi:hypothetical protein LQ327_17785 [Actinomycetospora endophytica]|uniref:Uncharacterized protein n=1 Tax=Actinomycetospora endophytica TaxID=2291215 RepID=A0ABS8PAC1_9PSEU|nr:hypothetical protein [Actinomycetospora endophytica]MCD2195222.1 hypothetical protein [Actinomycetospora endophytica]
MSRFSGYLAPAVAAALLAALVAGVALGRIVVPDVVALLLEATVAIAVVVGEVVFQSRR